MNISIFNRDNVQGSIITVSTCTCTIIDTPIPTHKLLIICHNERKKISINIINLSLILTYVYRCSSDSMSGIRGCITKLRTINMKEVALCV